MTIDEAIQLIYKGIDPAAHVWADLGAGSGIFTLALKKMLPDARILSVDKKVDALHQLQRSHPWLEVMEGDFTRPLKLPPLDGIIMANALHYASEPEKVLELILSKLKKGGHFILIEYDISTPVRTWVPYPVPFQDFTDMAIELGLEAPQLIGSKTSVFNRGRIYAALVVKP